MCALIFSITGILFQIYNTHVHEVRSIKTWFSKVGRNCTASQNSELKCTVACHQCPLSCIFGAEWANNLQNTYFPRISTISTFQNLLEILLKRVVAARTVKGQQGKSNACGFGMGCSKHGCPNLLAIQC